MEITLQDCIFFSLENVSKLSKPGLDYFKSIALRTTFFSYFVVNAFSLFLHILSKCEDEFISASFSQFVLKCDHSILEKQNGGRRRLQ